MSSESSALAGSTGEESRDHRAAGNTGANTGTWADSGAIVGRPFVWDDVRRDSGDDRRRAGSGLLLIFQLITDDLFQYITTLVAAAFAVLIPLVGKDRMGGIAPVPALMKALDTSPRCQSFSRSSLRFGSTYWTMGRPSSAR